MGRSTTGGVLEFPSLEKLLGLHIELSHYLVLIVTRIRQRAIVITWLKGHIAVFLSLHLHLLISIFKVPSHPQDRALCHSSALLFEWTFHLSHCYR